MHSNEATLPEASSGSHGASDQVAAGYKLLCYRNMMQRTHMQRGTGSFNLSCMTPGNQGWRCAT